MSAKIKISALVVFIISLGFIRDYFFMNINWILMTITNGRRNQALDEFHFLLNWTPAEINTLKWVLTFGFSALFMSVTYLIIRMSFQNKLFNQITVYGYLGILVFAFGLYFLSFVFGMSDNLYGIIRTIMGIAQSFMPLMILYILFKFLPTSKQEKLT
ncbi:MAG: hypothetical protein JNJ99_13195 [Crocinitomicaceae bacterium]|nr:hypothetical protein [Crocinitomicaceae bacterium]